MVSFIYQASIYIVCFVISLYSLMAIDFEKFIRKGKTFQTQSLTILLAMALGYLVANFIFALMYKNLFI